MRIYFKINWLILLALIISMLLPSFASAQNVETGLVITVLPNNFNIDLTAGKDNLLALDIKNAGPTIATNIRLTVFDKPEGWEVNFVPSTISSLGIGKNQTVEVHIKPVVSAARTNYSITLIAQANETQQSQTLYVNVAEGSFWIWIGGALAIVIVGAFVFIFIRSNRQKT
jgi:uncharacterized membrane protein